MLKFQEYLLLLIKKQGPGYCKKLIADIVSLKIFSMKLLKI